MTPQYDHRVEVTIIEIGARGDGIGTVDGRKVFVPFTLPGERVVAELAPARGAELHGRAIEWLARAPARIAPACRHFGTCGGCALQHWEAAGYAAWKSGLAATALRRAGVEPPPMAPLAATPPGTRRRASLAARRIGDGVMLGFHERASDRIVDVAACPVLLPDLVACLAPLRGLLGTLLDRGGRADVEALAAPAGVDLLLTLPWAPDRAARERIAAFAAAQDLARIAWRGGAEHAPEIVAQRRGVSMTFGGVAVGLPPGVFLQASEAGERAIVDAVTAALDGARSVADLFAGCGTLAFPLARAARVHAVEGDETSITALGAAARRAGLASRVTVERRDLARRPLAAPELLRFYAVVFGPPRAGARAQAAQLAASKVPAVVGVSCNPATFARDARILVDGGYRLVSLAPIDQFLWSPHLELVGVFRR